MLCQCHHVGANRGDQVLLSWQVLNRLCLEHTVEIGLALRGVIQDSVDFTSQAQHSQIDFADFLGHRQRLDFGLRLG